MNVFDITQKYGLYIGLSLTALVVGLLLYLHLGAKPEVSQRDFPSDHPDIIRCEGQVEWVDEAAPKAMDYWREHGRLVGALRVEPCDTLCDWTGDDKILRHIPCDPDDIVVALWDDVFDTEHVGKTITRISADGDALWSTILVPSEFGPAGLLGGDELGSAAEFPAGVESLVLTHEMGHWFGLGHVKTHIVGPFYAVPSGHIMHPNVYKVGWGDAGIDP